MLNKVLALCLTAFVVTACVTSIPARQQVVLTCDGAATTMKVVKGFVDTGKITDIQTLQDIKSATILVTETCLDPSLTPETALDIIMPKVLVLLNAREGV